MDKTINPRPLRLPARTDYLVREYAKKKGLGINQAIIHLIAKGLSIEKWAEDYHIENFTENFFNDQ